MSGATNFPFGKLVPGFDFLQGLADSAVKGASQALPQLPSLGSWVAPTLNPEELDKRIKELKAVQFWLDQNAIALKATIQALEVQKMTLATLRGMNVAMGDVANVFKLKGLDPAAEVSMAPPPKPKVTKRRAPVKKPADKTKSSQDPANPGVVDPMQWWGALTQQFQNIAASAMADAAQKGAIDATRNVATGIAREALRTAGGLATAASDRAVKHVSDRQPAEKAATRSSRRKSK